MKKSRLKTNLYKNNKKSLKFKAITCCFHKPNEIALIFCNICIPKSNYLNYQSFIYTEDNIKQIEKNRLGEKKYGKNNRNHCKYHYVNN